MYKYFVVTSGFLFAGGTLWASATTPCGSLKEFPMTIKAGYLCAAVALAIITIIIGAVAQDGSEKTEKEAAKEKT